MLDDNPSTVELSAEDEAWIGAIADRVMLVWGWDRKRAEREARYSVIEFYERGEKREIEEALQTKRQAYQIETKQLRAEADARTKTENQRRQEVARDREQRARAHDERQQYIERARRKYEESQNTAERRRAREHEERIELGRRQRAAWRSANGVGDEHGSTFDYSHSFYDAMVESASEYEDELVKGETVDTVVRWQANNYAPYFEVEWATKYEIEPEELAWGATWQWSKVHLKHEGK